MGRVHAHLAMAATAAISITACAPTTRLAVAPEVFSTEWRGASPAGQPIDVGLGRAFGSPLLQDIIGRALVANTDIAVAQARIAQARAQLAVARAAMLPVVSGSAGINATRTDNQGGRVFDFSAGFAGLDVAFDTDLFGGKRAERRAALNRAEAALFDRDAASLVVEAEVARAFVQHSALGDRIALLDRNLEHARELERIVRIRSAKASPRGWRLASNRSRSASSKPSAPA